MESMQTQIAYHRAASAAAGGRGGAWTAPCDAVWVSCRVFVEAAPPRRRHLTRFRLVALCAIGAVMWAALWLVAHVLVTAQLARIIDGMVP